MIGIQGDNHGNISTLFSNIDYYGSAGMTIFHVGDFGYNLGGEYQNEYKYGKSLKYINKFLKGRGITMYVIRGNHDNPNYFDGRFMLSNIKLVRDYTVVNVLDSNWLMVGGAISIDRGGRKQGISYWKEEEFDLNWDKYKDLRDIDYVITHTAPAVALDMYVIVSDVVKNFADTYNDATLEQDVRIERSQMQSMCETLKENNNIKNWYYGHYHFQMNNEHAGTKFRCVAIDELLEHR